MKKQVAKNGLVQFAHSLKEYRALLAEEKALERSAKRYENREDDDGEFVYLAYRRAAERRRQAADELIDDVAARL